MNEINVSEMKEQSAQHGALRSAVGATADVVDQLMAGAFSIAKGAQGRALTTAVTAVDWAESVQRSGFDLAREIVARLDSTSRAALDAGEAVASALSRAVRDAGTTVSAALSRSSTPLGGDDIGRRAA
jgi:hypothetical protein